MAQFTPDAIPVHVIKPWTTSYTPALAVRRGEPLSLKGTDPDNPGWRWAKNADRFGGWSPIDLIDGDHLTEDFDSTELTFARGDTIRILQTRAGWCLCQADDGRKDWLPAPCLSLMKPFPKG